MQNLDLVQINNNWPDDVFGIDINLGNYCNYKCWYCFPGSNTGTHKFPDIDLIKNNLGHLIEYYRSNTNKKVFDIHFSGGEVTHWKEFPELVKFLKDNFDCLISMTSNGSKKISWWENNARYFDRIHMSYHHEYADLDQFRNLCDYLYEQNVVVSVSVMMDPNAWDKCIGAVEFFKNSRRRWTIRYVEIYNSTISYNEDQRKILEKHRARRVNLFFFWKNNKYYSSRLTAVDSNNKKYKFQDNGILLHRLNNFYGWECSAGVNWINVSYDGTISATCNNFLYDRKDYFNLYDKNFKETFNPTIKNTICEKTFCGCLMETAMPKRKLLDKKVIPIYER
jgi:MoaA/NifB/PqqE/SkfB family radical SAM enzyme